MPTLVEKKAVVEDITANLEQAAAIYITNYKGMSVDEINDLRTKFRDGEIHFKVYKNTLMKRTMEEVGGFDELYPYLNEQNAFAFVEEDLGAPAKVLKSFFKDHGKPQFKAALIEGDLYSEEHLDALASMKSKEEIIGDILGLLTAPIRNIVGGLQAQGSNIAGAIQTIAEKGEEQS
ncbi:MAG: 50S ribosomal protein L10 [Balneolaceae bacterium]